MKRFFYVIVACFCLSSVFLGGYYFFVKKKTNGFMDAVTQSLGPHGGFSYGRITKDAHDGWIHIYDLKIRNDAQTFLIGEVLFKPSALHREGQYVFFPQLNLNHIEIISPSGSLTVKQLQVEDITFSVQADHVAILGLTQENDYNQKGLTFRAFGLHGYASAMGAVVNAAGLAVITPPGSLQSNIKLQNFSFISEIPPLNHIEASSFVMDDLELVALYRQFTQNITPSQHVGVQDMVIDSMFMKEGSNPFFSVDHFLTHTHRMEKSEQDISVVRNLILRGQRPYLTWLYALGYGQFKGDILLNTTQIPQLQRVHVEALNVEAENMGHLTLSGEFKMSPKHMAFMSLQPDMQVINMTLQYRDKGLAQRVLSIFSSQAKEAQALYIKKLHKTYQNNPWFSDILAWLDHINTNRLIITAEPRQPFAIMQFFSALNHLASSPYLAKMGNMHIRSEED